VTPENEKVQRVLDDAFAKLRQDYPEVVQAIEAMNISFAQYMTILQRKTKSRRVCPETPRLRYNIHSGIKGAMCHQSGIRSSTADTKIATATTDSKACKRNMVSSQKCCCRKGHQKRAHIVNLFREALGIPPMRPFKRCHQTS
jgi:hypothetical protein